MTLPPCDKCQTPVDDELRCAGCRREYTWFWVQLKQKGER